MMISVVLVVFFEALRTTARVKNEEKSDVFFQKKNEGGCTVFF